MVIALAGLVLAFGLLLVFGNRHTRSCRWRATGRDAGGKYSKYKCMTCGALTDTTTGKPPQTCLKRAPLPGP